MSHFTRIKTKLSDGDLVEDTLRALGLKYSRKNEAIRGWGRGVTTAEFRITLGASSYDIGLQRKGNSYEVVADWMGVRGISREKFVSDLNRTYALLGTKKLLEKQGFNVSSEVKQTDGSIKMVLKKREFVKA
jgi:hypothetical protein